MGDTCCCSSGYNEEALKILPNDQNCKKGCSGNEDRSCGGMGYRMVFSVDGKFQLHSFVKTTSVKQHFIGSEISKGQMLLDCLKKCNGSCPPPPPPPPLEKKGDVLICLWIPPVRKVPCMKNIMPRK